MRVLVIQHDHLSPPGEVGRAFERRGYDVVEHVVVPAEKFATPGVDTQFPDVEDFDAVVTMGAPWSAYDALVGSWVTTELELLQTAHELGTPVLGICFGGQMLALAHGGEVAASAAPEIGWYDVESDDETLLPSGPWFEWHYDRWTLPTEATEVARTEAASQAFVLGRNLAVQFHPELDTAMLTGWIGNGGGEQMARRGIDQGAVLAQTADREELARGRASYLVNAFLDRFAGA